MAFYKYSTYLTVDRSDAFDTVYKPGETTPHSGIYRCGGCAVEIASEAGKPLPLARSCSEHHPNKHIVGEISWKLMVSADGRGK
jgi:hypothetical protein